MKVIYKESIFDKISQENTMAEMNGKRIAYCIVDEDEWRDILDELKIRNMRFYVAKKERIVDESTGPYYREHMLICGVKIYKEGTI